MNAREYMAGISWAYETLGYLDKLVDQMGEGQLSELYQSERCDLFSRCKQAEGLFAQMPSAVWSQVMRRKYFYRWPMKRIARELGISTRGAYYALANAMEWMDAHISQDSTAHRA